MSLENWFKFYSQKNALWTQLSPTASLHYKFKDNFNHLFLPTFHIPEAFLYFLLTSVTQKSELRSKHGATTWKDAFQRAGTVQAAAR